MSSGRFAIDPLSLRICCHTSSVLCPFSSKYCSNTGFFLIKVPLDELNVINGQIPNEDGSFIIQLPKSQVTVKLRPLTYGEVLEISKLEESYPKGRVVPKVTWRLQKEIIEVNGTTDKAEIAKFIEQMPILDSKFIRKFMNDNEPRLDLSRVVITPSGEKMTVNVGFGVDFFRPFF